MTDQKQHWNSLHSVGQLDHYADTPTDFAKEVHGHIPNSSHIIELGCGAGNDAIFFARSGHIVVATDFSSVAIEKNKKRYPKDPNLTFTVVDIENRLPYPDDSFDVIYARLSLHYFSHYKTKGIFQELRRILKPNGMLCFMCKSTSDPLYGKGREIEPDMYEHKGHVRHFFNEEYIHTLIDGRFTIEKLESGMDLFYNDPSAYVKVIARVNKKYL